MTDRFLQEAIDLAVASVTAGGGPFGAVVVQAGEVIGRGTNRVVLDHDPSAHAEVLAIRTACAALGTHDLSGCTLFASCEPCPMCRGAIQWARIAHVRYACTRDDAAAAGFDDRRFFDEDPAERTDQEVAAPSTRRRAQAAFEAWRAREDRVPY